MLLFFLLLYSLGYAGEVEIGRDNNHKSIKITYNDKYSLKDFTNQTLLDATDLNGITIYGSCFSKEFPDTRVFPDNMTGVTFYNSNLDNVLIPPGNTVIGGSRRKFKAQNDMRDWILDGTGKPTKLVNEEYWDEEGFSIDPAKIPLEKIKNFTDDIPRKNP